MLFAGNALKTRPVHDDAGFRQYRWIIQSCCLLLCMLSAVLATAQGQLHLQDAKKPTVSVPLKSIEKQRRTYVAVSSIASGLRCPAENITSTRQVELRVNDYTLRITPANPFISVTDTKNLTGVTQLPYEAEQQGTDLYVPVESFIKILHDIMPEEISYDKNLQRIVVGKIITPAFNEISKVTMEPKTNGYLLRIWSAKKITDYESWLKPVDDGTWLNITLPDVRADLRTLNANKPGGVVKELLAFQSPTSLQLTLKLTTKIRSTEVMAATGGNDLLVAIHTPPAEEAKVAKLEETLERTRNRWKLDCIVIDAGHGGDDPGALGVKKTKEKEITLAIAQKLGNLIEQQMENVKVVYTRKTDTFIELYRRGQIANAAGGKLFISIHCNSTPRKKSQANGFEIYLLRPGKTENAVSIAARENEVVKLEKNYQDRYQELTEEQFILVTMAQSAYVKYSEQFAGILQGEMARYLPVKNNGVKQAGFYVLVGASMPNVLVEAGYLSNKKEEQYLKSTKGQDQLAAAIFQGIKKYKAEYEKSLEEGAAEGGVK